ncbi:hypothetical protein C0584_03320 [Candidatus Parcubacteria bacterium]|nr:MAG: hypothetical protein C0584_03320 [Candidatus Parcubacteria bacterium]
MKKIFFIILFLFLPIFGVSAQKEGELSLSPKIIDDEGAARDILEYNIKLKNNANYKLNIFPLLEELQEEGSTDNPELMDRQFKLIDWISIKRGAIEIMPNAEITLPLKIDINYDAVPGDYFAAITFAHGNHRLEAENNALEMSPPKLFINLIVEDQTVEKASALNYYPTKKVFTNPIPSLFLEINNSGNVDIVPQGNIYVYNKRGEEVDFIKVNPEAKTIPPANISNFEITGTTKLKTGKYKAKLEIEYGDKQTRDIQDTVYLIVITLPFLIFFGTLIILFIILLSILIFRKTHHPHPQHQASLQIGKEKVKINNDNNSDIIDLKRK